MYELRSNQTQAISGGIYTNYVQREIDAQNAGVTCAVIGGAIGFYSGLNYPTPAESIFGLMVGPLVGYAIGYGSVRSEPVYQFGPW